MAGAGATAIVIGASIGGLVAARALSDHFDEVLVVEKDDLGDDFAARKGVPQGRHTHALLAQGAGALERFFPGLSDDARAAGAVPIELGRDALWFKHGVYLKQSMEGEFGYSLSRPRFEGLIRRRLLARGNVRLLDRTEAIAPIADATRQRVIGLRTQTSGEAIVERAAALVVDAGGRGARMPLWLESLGFSRPAEDKVRVDLVYTTCKFRRRPGELGGNLGIVMTACDPDWRGGAIAAQEDDVWTASLSGFLGDRAPTDVAGFLEFARSLQKPDLYDVLKGAEPLGAPFAYHIPTCLRRRYERLARFPEGCLAFGDALCSFNPIYGQGMTVAACEGEALARCLALGLPGLAPRFFKAAAKVIDIPWDIAVGSDLGHPAVLGPRPLRTRFINWWVRQIFLAGADDAALARKFVRVANLSAPPESLLSPDAVLRVLRRGLRFGASAAPARGAEAAT